MVDPDGRMRLWNATGDRPTGDGFAGQEDVTAVVCMPDGRLPAVAVGHGVVRWDPTSGLRHGLAMTRHKAPVRVPACSTDSDLLASGDAAGTVLLSGTDGRTVPGPPAGPPGEIHDLALSPDGTPPAIAAHDGLRLWSPVARAPMATLLGGGWLSPLSLRGTDRGPAPVNGAGPREHR
ncbi:WD40 repeat domain-containing protein [Streptomyces nojiriensis]